MRLHPVLLIITDIIAATYSDSARGAIDAFAQKLPADAITTNHGSYGAYGKYQVQGLIDERIKVNGRKDFDDSFCAFEIKHENYVPVVGGLTLCRCESIYYNMLGTKHFLPVKVHDFQATNSAQWQEGEWTDVGTVFIEDTVCSPGPCCKKGLDPPVPPLGYVRPSTPTTTTTTISTTTSGGRPLLTEPDTGSLGSVPGKPGKRPGAALPNDTDLAETAGSSDNRDKQGTPAPKPARPEFIVGVVFCTLSLATIIGILMLMTFRIRAQYGAVKRTREVVQDPVT